MSSIPNSAMPYAHTETDRRSRRRERLNRMIAGGRRWAGTRYDSASRTVREHPRIAMSAVGAALIASLAAAFGPRLWRQRAAFGL